MENGTPNEAFSMSGMNATAPQPRGWEYHELWNLSSLSKILQGKRTKKVQIHSVPFSDQEKLMAIQLFLWMMHYISSG